MTENSNGLTRAPRDAGSAYADYESARNTARRLADEAHHYSYGDGADPVTGAALAAEAQAYATLALAAATLAAASYAAGTGDAVTGGAADA